jgi:hypothetical protein
MTISYPKPIKVKHHRRDPLPVAPTHALRAAFAISDAQRYLGTATGQVFFGIMFSIILLDDVRLGFGFYGIVVSAVAQFGCLAAAIWAMGQGQSFGVRAHSSGQSARLSRAEICSLVAIGTIVVGFVAFLVFDVQAWQRGGLNSTAIVPLTRLLCAVMPLTLAAFMIFRAISALKFAHAQVTQLDGLG